MFIVQYTAVPQHDLINKFKSYELSDLVRTVANQTVLDGIHLLRPPTAETPIILPNMSHNNDDLLLPQYH